MNQHILDLAKATIIHSLRQRLKVTLAQFAKLVAVDPKTVEAWEDCTRPPLTTDLIHVCKCLKVLHPRLEKLISDLAGVTLRQLGSQADSIKWEYKTKPE